LNSQYDQARIAFVKRISITAAKNGLSALIGRVRQGESMIIEDRGVPVARLESVVAPGRDVEGRAARLLRQGVLQPALAAPPKHLLATPPPKPTGGATASGALIDERREGR
jgi:prevent-host-death family protein